MRARANAYANRHARILDLFYNTVGTYKYKVLNIVRGLLNTRTRTPPPSPPLLLAAAVPVRVRVAAELASVPRISVQISDRISASPQQALR